MKKRILSMILSLTAMAALTATAAPVFADETTTEKLHLSYDVADVILESDVMNYTGNALTQTGGILVKAIVKGEIETLVNDVDYTVSYRDNTDPGLATVVIEGKGNYEGTLERHFTIAPEITFTLEEVRPPEGGVSSYGVITASDFKGNQMWNITTDTYHMVQAGSLVGNIGIKNGMYYCNINGITTFDLETGDVIWVNEDLTQVSSMAFMSNGNLCAKGAFGTSVYVISPEGVTIHKWDLSAYVSYVWLSPVIEGVVNGKLRVNMTWGCGSDTYVYLDTDTGAVTYEP